MNEPAADFAVLLRAQRERRGLTLDQVAASTKIKSSLLGALERGDLTHWPKGIYGRAFVRAYADAIGVSSESLLEDVLRRCRTSDESAAVADDGDASEAIAASSLRLTLGSGVPARRRTTTYAADAAMTLVAVLSIAALVAAVGNVSFATAAAIVALVWYPIAHGVCGGFSPTRLVTKIRCAGTVVGYARSEGAHQSVPEYQVTN